MAERRGITRAALAAAALLLAACGSDGAASSSTAVATTEASGDRVLAGIVREPAPSVDGTPVPSLTNPGTDVVFRGEPGGYQAVYFGFTNCPDVCPTTLADWTVALRRLPPEIAERIDTVMVTVDPERDNELLPGYIESFIPDGQAAGTLDDAVLAAAAEPFGASYSVTTTDEGDIEVAHSGFLYFIDDQGTLLVTWPFGISSADLAADVEQVVAEGRDVSGRRPIRMLAAVVAGLVMAACGGGDGESEPATEAIEEVDEATYEFVIPVGAGEALDAGTPLEILPAELEVRVGETIRIVNEDARGHSVGPFFVGANETLTQQFSSPGEFVGVCTVHPSGQIVLTVVA